MTRREKLKAGVVRAAHVVAEHLSFRDLMLFGGLALGGYGLSLIYFPAAFFVPGGVLVAVAIFGVR